MDIEHVFDYPKYESHTETINRLKGVLAQIDPHEIASAFLFSLSTRRLEYRSALGSYYYAKAIPEHELMKSLNEVLAAHADHCYLCGWTAWKKEPDAFDLKYDLNLFDRFRHKYGGFPRSNISFALFDLEQFLKLPKVIHTDEDVHILKSILSCVDRLNDSDKAGKLRDAVVKEKLLKSNRDEVAVLLDGLGICGILAGRESPSYDVFFADEYQRAPIEHKNGFAYPINRWHAADGVNTEKLIEVFGDIF